MNAASNSGLDSPCSSRSVVRHSQRSRARSAASSMPARRILAMESRAVGTQRLSHREATLRGLRCPVQRRSNVRRMPADLDLLFPVGNPDERELLLGWLRWLRGAVLRKIDGLNEVDARWTPDGALISLLGIVNHLTHVEWRWIDGAM